MDTYTFKPNLTPKECIQKGIFGGIYFNPVGGKPGIISKRININYKEFPDDWFEGLNESIYRGKEYNKYVNKYKVVSGKNQEFWERKGWINKQDPRGWFQWYCRYYMGRRSEDDERQIKRWNGVCGKKGRWKKFLINKIISKSKTKDDVIKNLNDYSISPKVRQLLLHWGYEITLSDLLEFYK